MSIIENASFNTNRISSGADQGEDEATYHAEDKETYAKMKELTLSRKLDGLIDKKKRLISAGQLGSATDCSIINPGVLHRKGEFQFLCRAEANEKVWLGEFLEHQATPMWCVFDDDLKFKHSFPLHYQEFLPESRPEDWRLFEYQGKLYTNHSIYIMKDWDKWIVESRPGISEIDLETHELRLCCVLNPPFTPSSEEKNWSFFVHDGSLLCIYSFRPYIILEIDLQYGNTKKIIEAPDLNFQWHEKGKFIGNSTNLVSWDDEHYILFIHDFLDPEFGQRNRAYMQYAALISKTTLLPISVIPKPLVIGGIEEEGRHPGVHYTSSLVNCHDGLYAFYGEGDTHISTVVFNKDELARLFKLYRI